VSELSFALGHPGRRSSWFLAGSKRNFPRMAIYPLRKLPALPIAGIESQWLEKLGAELKSGADRALLCRRTLCEIAYPQYAANWDTAVEDAKLPLGTRIALSSLDNSESVEKGRDAGFEGYVAKFDRHGLIAALKETSSRAKSA